MSAEQGNNDQPGMSGDMSSNDLAMSEGAFLRLQKQRPLGSIRRQGAQPRPSEITVTEPTYLNYKEPVRSEAASSALRQADMTPRRSSSPFGTAASPSANYRRASASPRHLSPATSQIFERDVQESTLAPELSPAIPAHLQTEDHIPPVLEASSEVITNNRLNPDDVEVVTHTMHQPAAASVTESGIGESQPAHVSDTHLSAPQPEPVDESSSTYGAVDPSDPRRLSFISFADVIHGEQVETGKEPSSHLMSPASMAPSQHGRSPSPVRSPLGERPLSPPMSGSGSMKGVEASPSRGPPSISSGHGGQHGDITIHTMRETMEKTGTNEMQAAPGTPI